MKFLIILALFITGTLPAEEIYTNNLKNWDFGKAGAQSLNQQSDAETAQLEQAPQCRQIQNLECPAQPKTNSSDCLCIGMTREFRFTSACLGNQRPLWVYTPPHYSAAHKPYHLLFIFDGEAYMQLIPTPAILNRLINQGAIEPVVAVLVGSLSQEARNVELPCNFSFLQFLSQELLPWVRANYHVTQNPAQTIVAGSSYGGLAACFAGLERPDLFGKVLSQSGAFWWNPVKEDENSQQCWLLERFQSRPGVSLTFYLDVGKLEPPNMIHVNHRFCEMLREKGYSFHFAEFNGGHDYNAWQETLSDGLIALIGKKNGI